MRHAAGLGGGTCMHTARLTLLDSTSTGPTGCLQVPLAEAPATLPGQVLQQIADEFQGIHDPKQRMQVRLLSWCQHLQQPESGGKALLLTRVQLFCCGVHDSPGLPMEGCVATVAQGPCVALCRE